MCNEVKFDINLKLTKFALKWVLTWRDSFIFKYCNHGKYVKFHLKMKRLHPRAGPSSRHMAISKHLERLIYKYKEFISVYWVSHFSLMRMFSWIYYLSVFCPVWQAQSSSPASHPSTPSSSNNSSRLRKQTRRPGESRLVIQVLCYCMRLCY